MLSGCLDLEGLPMLNVWNMSTLELVHTLQKKNNESPAVKSSKINICITNNSRYVVFGKRSLAVFDLVIGECLLDLDTEDMTSFSNLQVDSDDSRILACSQPGNLVCIWSMTDGKKNFSLQHPAEVIFFMLLLAGKKLLSVCSEGKFRVWCLKSQECLTCLDGFDEGKVLSCATITPSANSLVTGSTDGQIKVWSLKPFVSSEPSLIVESEFAAPVTKEPLLSILAHSDTTLVLRDSSSASRICHLHADQEPNIIALKGHDGLITCTWTCDPDAKDSDSLALLVTGSKDDTLKVWSLEEDRKSVM